MELGVDRARILSTALSLIEGDGGDELNMRALASRLGVTPKALYRYFGSKNAILRAVSDMVIEQMNLPSAALRWDDRLRDLLDECWQIRRRYPRLARRDLVRTLVDVDELDEHRIIAAIRACFHDAGLDDPESSALTMAFLALWLGELTLEGLAMTPQEDGPIVGQGSRVVIDLLVAGIESRTAGRRNAGASRA